MKSLIQFLVHYYSGFTMALVVGTGIFAYFVDYKNMLKKNREKEAKISKYIGLTYIVGGVLLYAIVMVLG